jgi:hypothetical protein
MSSRLTAGMRLGPYEILAPLGAGGMGRGRSRPRLEAESRRRAQDPARAEQKCRLKHLYAHTFIRACRRMVPSVARPTSHGPMVPVTACQFGREPPKLLDRGSAGLVQRRQDSSQPPGAGWFQGIRRVSQSPVLLKPWPHTIDPGNPMPSRLRDSEGRAIPSRARAISQRGACS